MSHEELLFSSIATRVVSRQTPSFDTRVFCNVTGTSERHERLSHVLRCHTAYRRGGAELTIWRPTDVEKMQGRRSFLVYVELSWKVREGPNAGSELSCCESLSCLNHRCNVMQPNLTSGKLKILAGVEGLRLLTQILIDLGLCFCN